MYTPLYIKTNNSLLQSLIKLDDLISFAKKNNIRALTITDNNMYGVIDFYKICLKNDIKPIIGLEIIFDTNIVLYAKNYDGYKNLIKLSTIQSERMINSKELLEFSSEIICIVPFESRKYYKNLEKIYNDIFVGYKNESEYKKIKLQNKVYMNPIYYLEKEDSTYIKYLFAIKDGKLAKDIDNYPKDNYLKLDVFSLENNELISNMCNVEINKVDGLLPKYETPDNVSSLDYLKKLCKEGLIKKLGKTVPKVYLERLKYEIDIINKMGFCDYFLVVWDYVKWAKDNNILVGPGRGSAAGSLVSYCLDIITIDPIKHDLIFERFLNPERVSMPDIDMDFEDTSRQKVIDYCISKYGKKRVVPIISFSNLSAKQAVRDVAKAMDIDDKLISNVSKNIDSNKSLSENLLNNKKLVEMLDINEELKIMYKIARKLENIKRHTSVHAAGVIITNRDIDEVIPLDKSHDFYTTGIDMKYLEELGLLKMDFLAINNLTIIHEILNDINTDLTFDNIPENDQKTFELFRNSNTMGIFQFESPGIKSHLPELKISKFDDMVMANAICRPGPKENIPLLSRRKEGKERIDYLDDSLIDILKPTYGIILYQEQIMKIANVMASYSLGEADILRKAMGKKIESIMVNEREKFINNSIKNGYSREIAEKVFNLIAKFAEYGFNKAHSVGYALVSYRMGYLKANYPKQFYKNTLTNSISDKEKTGGYINEIKKSGIKILTPDVSYSSIDYKVEESGIRYPLTGIKGINSIYANNIINERKIKPFDNIFDFLARCYSKIDMKCLESLIFSGALDSFGFNRRTIIENLDVLINYSEIALFLDDESRIMLEPIINVADEYEKRILIEKEFELYGFYFSSHPVSELKENIPNVQNINDIANFENRIIDLVVMIDKIKEITTKKNEKMAFITGTDETGSIDIVMFPSAYQKYNNIEIGNICRLSGKIENRKDGLQLVTNSLQKLN